MRADEIRDKLMKSIDILINERIKKLKFNRYIEGKIVSRIESTGNYIVNINGENETLPARSGVIFSENEVVLICVVNGNSSFKFIDTKKPY